MIHGEALVAKRMSTDLHEVLSAAIKIINYIKSNALNSCLFRNLCQDMDSEYQSLLLILKYGGFQKEDSCAA